MRLLLVTGLIHKKVTLMAHIDYFFATISPFTYLAGTGLEEIAQKHGATIAYKPMDLMTVFSRTGGVPPKDRHISRIELRAQELPRQAKKRKLPLNLQPAFFPVNMAPSSLCCHRRIDLWRWRFRRIGTWVYPCGLGRAERYFTARGHRRLS
jgi:2-hydroxychromene-2-carboxylate isomerase